MPQARLTTHCSQRLKERMTLLQEELCRILNDDLVVLVGQESGTNRIHKLFYSIYDETFYVAVQDELTGGVITILPPEQSRWRIAPEAYSRAKSLICDSVESATAIIPQSEKPVEANPLPTLLKFTVLMDQGRKIARFKVRDRDHISCLLDLESDPAERMELFEKLLFEKIKCDRDLLFYAAACYQVGCGKSDPLIPYPIN